MLEYMSHDSIVEFIKVYLDSQYIKYEERPTIVTNLDYGLTTTIDTIIAYCAPFNIGRICITVRDTFVLFNYQYWWINEEGLPCCNNGWRLTLPGINEPSEFSINYDGDILGYEIDKNTIEPFLKFLKNLFGHIMEWKTKEDLSEVDENNFIGIVGRAWLNHIYLNKLVPKFSYNAYDYSKNDILNY